MTTTTKPRWVECADKAAELLEAARTVDDRVAKDGIVNEAHAWMRLADIYCGNREREAS